MNTHRQKILNDIKNFSNRVGIDLLDEYQDSRDKLTWKCRAKGHISKSSWMHFQMRDNCNQCYKESYKSAPLESITDFCQKSGIKLLKQPHEILENQGKNTPPSRQNSEWVCPLGHIFLKVWKHLKKAGGCPRCQESEGRWTVEEIEKELIDKGFVLESKFESTHKNTAIKDIATGKVYQVHLSNLFQGMDPRNRRNEPKSIQEIKNELEPFGFTILSTNIDRISEENLRIICKRGHEIEAYYYTLKRSIEENKAGCYKCNLVDSQPEREVAAFVESLGYKITRNKRSIFNNRDLEVDIFIEEMFTGVEYNGDYHHSIQIDQNRFKHQQKGLEAYRMGMALYSIWGKDWSLDKNKVLEDLKKWLLDVKEKRFLGEEISLSRVIPLPGYKIESIVEPRLIKLSGKFEAWDHGSLKVKKSNPLETTFLGIKSIQLSGEGLEPNFLINGLPVFVLKLQNEDRKAKFIKSYAPNSIIFFESEITDKPEIVKSILLNRTHNKDVIQVYGRDCCVEKASNEESIEFVNNSHLQGHTHARYLKLVHNNKTVAMFGYKLMKTEIPNRFELEITRFCNALFTHVTGGFSKLLGHAIKTNGNVASVKSYSDLRYTSGNSYEKLGFIKVGESQGWFWTDGTKKYNRLKVQAAPNMTQEEVAKEKKWHMVFDAGQAKYCKNL